jgi:hypothetical protein
MFGFVHHFFCFKELAYKDLVSISFISFFSEVEKSRNRKGEVAEHRQKFSGLEHLEDNNDKNASFKIILTVEHL